MTTRMAKEPADPQKVEQFVHRVLSDTSATTTTVLGRSGTGWGCSRTSMPTGRPSAANSRSAPASRRAMRARQEEGP